MDNIIARATELINKLLESESNWHFPYEESRLIDTRNLLNRLLEPDSPRNNSARLFCRQLERLMNHDKPLPDDFWVQLHDDILCLLEASDNEQNKSNRWTHFFRRMNFEAELEQRELEFQQTFGERKSLNQIFCHYKEFFEVYLQKCISLHSKIQVQVLIENVDDLLRKDYGLTDILLTSETRQRLEEKFKYIEITLDCSNRLLNSFSLSFPTYDKSYRTDNISPSDFLPSTVLSLPMDETFHSENMKSLLLHHRWIVVLGDPGSAKTSCLRWITHIFAEAAYQSDDIIVLDRNHYLPIRIPILIRIGEFSSWLHVNPTKTLIDYIGKHTWFSQSYCHDVNENILKELVYHGHALILLDGLDEIPEVGERRKIVDHVRKFIDKYVCASYFVSAFDDALFDVRCPFSSNVKLFGMPPPYKSNGNQIIVTSRAIGYELHPLVGPPIVHSSLLLMDHTEAKQYAHDWMSQVEKAVLGILSNEGFELDRGTITALAQRRLDALERMFKNDLHLLMSNPSLLSLICTFIFQSPNEFHPKSRVELYNHAVHVALRSWKSRESSISTSLLTDFLINLATHLHLQSPSGLIDAFDMEHLCFLSLQQQSMSTNRAKLREYGRNLISLLDSNVGIIAERGLLVFGFLHLSFQEYFVAQRFVRGSAIDEIAKRILTFNVNPRFRESIYMALSWISWKWSFDDYNKFCTLLITLSMDFAIPFGTLLFFDAFNDFQRLPSISVIFTALNSILDHPSNIVARTYLLHNLFKLDENIIVKWMQSHLKDSKCLSKFCKCFLRKNRTFNDQSDFFNLGYLPSIIYRQLLLFYDMYTSVGFIIDQTFRRTKTPSFVKSGETSIKEFSSYFSDHNISLSNIHPAILSVIIAVCNGVNIEIRK
jgi:hypothetical protein